jgi:hypothetical protein
MPMLRLERGRARELLVRDECRHTLEERRPHLRSGLEHRRPPVMFCRGGAVACCPSDAQEDTRRAPFKTMAQAFKLRGTAPRERLNTV